MFVAWRDLRFAKGRFVLMGTVVVLITVLVVLVSGLTAGLAKESTSAITDLPADHVVFSAPAEGEDPSFTVSNIEEETWQAWAEVPGVTSVTPLAIATTRAQTNGGTASVSAFGVPAGSALAPSPNSLQGGAVVLSVGAAEALDTKRGETITLAGEELNVAAVDGDASFSHTPVIWTSLADSQALMRGRGDEGAPATAIALTTKSSADLADADAHLGTTTLTREDARSAIGSFTSENGSLQLMRGFLFVISALVIGAFFTVWTIQRSGDVAVLKALGGSTGYLLRDALGQAMVLLVLGTAVGTAIAVGAGAVIESAVPFVLDLTTVALPAGVLIVLGVAGAALAIRRITSVDPLTALGSVR